MTPPISPMTTPPSAQPVKTSFDFPKRKPVPAKSRLDQASHYTLGVEPGSFVRGLGLRWENPGKASDSYLQTIVELEDVFAAGAENGLVWEVTRILGEAHAEKLRSGFGLPSQVERRVMVAAFAQEFAYYENEIKNNFAQHDFDFDDFFSSASCTAKDAFHSQGDGQTFQKRKAELNKLRESYVEATIERFSQRDRKPLDPLDYIRTLNKTLPSLVEHSKKLSRSAQAKLQPKLEQLVAEAFVYNSLLAVFFPLGLNKQNITSRNVPGPKKRFEDDCLTIPLKMPEPPSI